MARMLGRIALGYDADLGTEWDTRTAKLLERRAFRREVDAYPDDLTEGRERRVAQYGWETGDPLYDWSDCRHGCNGDCESGSEVCTFVCHGGVADVDHDRALAYIAEFSDQDDEMVRGYVSARWAEDWDNDVEYDDIPN